MKLKTKLLGLAFALGASAIAYIGPENSYHEAKALFENNPVAEVKLGELEVGCRNTNHEYFTNKGAVCFSWKADGLKMKNLKLTLDDKLIGKAEVKTDEDNITLKTTNYRGNKEKKFPRNTKELMLNYSGVIDCRKKGKHTVRITGTDINGEPFDDEAYLRIK